MSPPDVNTLLTVASIVGAFGTSVLTFRLQREIDVATENGRNWVPWADWLMLSATFGSLLVVAALLALAPRWSGVFKLASATMAAAATLVAAYPFAILAHYRLLFGKKRSGYRDNPEPAEAVIVILAVVVAAFAAAIVVVGSTR